MKKWIIAVLILLIASLVPASTIEANSRPNFYAIGVDYKVSDNLTMLTGNIATVYVEATKRGAAGIEQDIQIATDNGTVLVEVVNWYFDFGGGFFIYVGIVVYKDDGYWFANRVPAQMGEIYNYELIIDDGVIYATIWNSQGKIMVHQEFGDDAQYIESTASYIEYWRWDEPEPFFYYGFVTIDNTEQLHYRDDFYHKSKLDIFNFYFIHHNWDGITDKGEIDDR